MLYLFLGKPHTPSILTPSSRGFSVLIQASQSLLLLQTGTECNISFHRPTLRYNIKPNNVRFHMYLYNCNIEYTLSRTKPLYDTEGLAAGWQRHDRGSCCMVAPRVLCCPLSSSLPSLLTACSTTTKSEQQLHTQPARSLSRLRTLSFNEVLRVHFEHEHYIADAGSK